MNILVVDRDTDLLSRYETSLKDKGIKCLAETSILGGINRLGLTDVDFLILHKSVKSVFSSDSIIDMAEKYNIPYGLLSKGRIQFKDNNISQAQFLHNPTNYLLNL